MSSMNHVLDDDLLHAAGATHTQMQLAANGLMLHNDTGQSGRAFEDAAGNRGAVSRVSRRE
jgi:hypothetical protein